MRILIYGINYAPELTGIGKYSSEMAEWLAEQGHEVVVTTALPYYPEWQVHEKYKGSLWSSETIKGVKVIRCPLYVPTSVSSAKRIIHELSFVASVLPVWVSSLFKKKFDLVFSVAPPFHLGFLPLLYSKMKGAVCVSHIQDLQVDAAAELGMIKNKGFLKAMFASEKFILDKSTYVSTISSGMLRRIKQKGINENKLILIPNWVDTSKIYPLSTEESLRSEFGIPFGDKVVLYSGNLGEKQGLTSILELANYFRNRANVHFLIVGAGGAKASLEQAAAEQNLHNLRFFPLQPFDRLSALLATADLHLVLQKGSASDLVMPSKLTGILAAGGCPVVTASPGTSLYDVVNSYKLGILVEPDSITALIKGVEKGLTEDIEKFKLNARIYAQEYLDRHSILTEFETKILKAI